MRKLLIALHGFIAAGALPAGAMFVLDPSSGGALEAKQSWLEGSPFGDFLVPGLFLFGMIGVGNALAAVGQVRRHELAAYVSMGCGLVLATWLVIQATIVPFNWAFHPGFFGIGATMLALGYVQWRRSVAEAG
jgi:uncharacterized membrane protein